jgi:PAS domain S-box-containing protein
LHAFVRNAPAPILVLDGAGVVREVNAEAERLLGRGHDDVVDRAAADLPLPRIMHERLVALRQEALAGRPLQPFVAEFAAPSGDTRPVRWVTSTMVDEAGLGLVLMGQDLSGVGQARS